MQDVFLPNRISLVNVVKTSKTFIETSFDLSYHKQIKTPKNSHWAYLHGERTTALSKMMILS